MDVAYIGYVCCVCSQYSVSIAPSRLARAPPPCRYCACASQSSSSHPLTPPLLLLPPSPPPSPPHPPPHHRPQTLHMCVTILELDVKIDENAPIAIKDPLNVPDKEFSLEELSEYDGHRWVLYGSSRVYDGHRWVLYGSHRSTVVGCMKQQLMCTYHAPIVPSVLTTPPPPQTIYTLTGQRLTRRARPTWQ
jgi:hypothetical protein